jgi:GDP-L-fucose synthase
MSILITGGSGLLGTSLNVDNSYLPSRKELNLLSYCQLESFIRKNNVKKIIHCAAMVGGVQANNQRMFDFFNANMMMNMNVLTACKQYELNNSIMILSTCVMPEHASLPYTESSLHDGKPHDTNYGYAHAKRMLHIGAIAMKRQYDINISCLIPCNLYGKNDNFNIEDGHVIPSLIHKCYLAKKNNTDFSIWGSGEAEREFIYADDFAKIIQDICHNNKYFSELLISPGISWNIKTIVDKIAKIMNFTGNIVYDKTKLNGIQKKTTDNSLFKQAFSNFQWTDIDRGLQETIDSFVKSYPNIRL